MLDGMGRELTAAATFSSTDSTIIVVIMFTMELGSVDKSRTLSGYHGFSVLGTSSG